MYIYIYHPEIETIEAPVVFAHFFPVVFTTKL